MNQIDGLAWCVIAFGMALLSVKLDGKRSSLNDFSSYANKLGKKLIAQKG